MQLFGIDILTPGQIIAKTAVRLDNCDPATCRILLAALVRHDTPGMPRQSGSPRSRIAVNSIYFFDNRGVQQKIVSWEYAKSSALNYAHIIIWYTRA
jgi:hypothetical protein